MDRQFYWKGKNGHVVIFWFSSVMNLRLQRANMKKARKATKNAIIFITTRYMEGRLTGLKAQPGAGWLCVDLSHIRSDRVKAVLRQCAATGKRKTPRTNMVIEDKAIIARKVNYRQAEVQPLKRAEILASIGTEQRTCFHERNAPACLAAVCGIN